MRIVTARPHRLLDVCIGRIGALTREGKRCMFLVPPQYTLQAEIEIMSRLKIEGSMTIDVLSPVRLRSRIFEYAGQPSGVPFDERGKCMVLSEVIEAQKENLTIYRPAAQSGAIGFVQKMSSLIADLKRSGKTAQDVLAAIDNMDEQQKNLPSSRKLLDAAKIYAAYKERMQDGLCDAEDVAAQMLEKMGRSGVLDNQHVLVYGFDMITPAFAQQLIAMEKHAASLTLYVETDSNSAADGRLFAPVNFSIDRLCMLASKAGSAMERERVDVPLDAPQEIQLLERSLFALGKKPSQEKPVCVELHAVSSVRQEAHSAAARIRRMLAEGGAASDIAIVYPKGSGYAQVLEHVCSQYGISAYIAEKRPALAHPLCRFVTSALAVAGSWRTADVLECVQSGMMQIEREEADAFCAYCEGMEIRGDAFKKPFAYIKNGDETALAAINATREKAVAPLISLKKALSEAKTADDTISAVIKLLDEVQAFETLGEMRDTLRGAGLESEAEDCAQVWNALMETLDQMHTLLSGSSAAAKTVLVLLESGLSALELSALPPADGAVICGEIGNVRTARVKTLFALGMNDSPGVQDSGLFSPQEQQEAADATGAYLGMSAAERAALAQLDELKMLSGARERLIVSYALADETGRALREGVSVQAIRRLFAAIEVRGGVAAAEREAMLCAPDAALEALSVALSTAADEENLPEESYAAAYAALKQSESGRKKLEAVTRRLVADAERKLSGTRARTLYGRPVMSVSRLETFAQCPYRHFVRYGLAPQEPLHPGVDRAELGTLYHEAAERFTRAVTQLPQFPDVDETTCDRLMQEASAPLIAAWRKSPLGESERGAAIARRISKTAKRAARSIVSQYAGSSFRPMQFEMVFGKNGVAPIMLELPDGTFVYLQGRIDRVDVYDGEKKCIRVIDYKSGAKKFDPTMAYFGIQLQLLLYLAAALSQIPGTQAAGFFYCRIADPLIRSESRVREEIEKQMAKKLALAGISLSDVSVLRAQDDRHSAMITKDGKPSGLYRASMTDAEGMDALVGFARHKAAQMAQAAYDGVISDDPAARGAYNACASCGYAAICGFDPSIRKHRMLAKKTVDDLRCQDGENRL